MLLTFNCKWSTNQCQVTNMYGVEMTTIKIEIKGAGGEFQHHYLSVKELKELLKVGKKGGGEAVVDELLTGGKMFDKS